MLIKVDKLEWRFLSFGARKLAGILVFWGEVKKVDR